MKQYKIIKLIFFIFAKIFIFFKQPIRYKYVTFRARFVIYNNLLIINNIYLYLLGV